VKYKPQLAEKCKDPDRYWGNGFYAIEPKLDGTRILAELDEPGLAFFSRNGKAYTHQLPELADSLMEALPRHALLDGELVCQKADGADWGSVQTALRSSEPHPCRHNLYYAIFDVLSLDGYDARPLSYINRRKLLKELFPEGNGSFGVTVSIEEPTEEIYETFLLNGYEGAILKRIDAPYASDERGKGWLKIKPELETDVVITGFKPGENGFAGMVGAIEFAQPDPKALGFHGEGTIHLIPRGRCSGMDMVTRKAMTNEPDKYIGKVMEIKYGMITGNGSFRFPQFKRMRHDKLPQDCHWDEG
jgi:ATP-dependent DNA ligase